MSRIEDLEKRLSVDPNSKIFVQLAEEYRKAGLQEDAIATCREGLEKHPNYFSARVALGRALLETDQLEEARGEFETVLEQVPDNLLALKFLGEALHKLGRLEDALSRYRLASTLSPEDADLADRIKQVEAAAAASHAPPAPGEHPSAGEQSVSPTLPPAKPSSQFIERQARELASEDVSEDILSMQEEFEDRPVTSIFHRQAREIQDLGSIPPPAGKASTPPAPPDAPSAADDRTAGSTPRETATIDLGGARIRKPLSEPEPRQESAEPVAPPPDPNEQASAQPPELAPIPFDAPAATPKASPPPGTPSDAAQESRPGLATTTLAELYVSQGHLDRAVNVYRQLVASKPDNPEFQSRLEELELLAAATREPERRDGRSDRGSSAVQVAAGPHAPAPSTDPNRRFLENAIRELEGWLAAIGRS